jgi:hypothetical protein
MRKQLLVALSDVQCIAVECPNCQSEVRLQIDAQIKFTLDKVLALEYCPICKSPYDSTLKMNVINLRDAWKALVAHSKVSLQINDDAISSKQ